MNIREAARIVEYQQSPFPTAKPRRRAAICLHANGRLQNGHGARLLDLWQDKSRASRDVKRLALDHIVEIRAKIAAMTSMRDAVQHLADACDGDERPECPILHDLEGAAVGHNR